MAVECAMPHCRRRTTEPEGRCWQHLDDSVAIATFLLPPPPLPPQPTMGTAAEGYRQLALEDGLEVNQADGATWSSEYQCMVFPVAKLGYAQEQMTDQLQDFILEQLVKRTPDSCGPVRRVPMELIRTVAQDSIRPDVLNYYLHDAPGTDPWDPDEQDEGTRYGAAGPLLVRFPDGHLMVLDGTHRYIAAELAGDTTFEAQVVDLARGAHQFTYTGRGERARRRRTPSPRPTITHADVAAAVPGFPVNFDGLATPEQRYELRTIPIHSVKIGPDHQHNVVVTQPFNGGHDDELVEYWLQLSADMQAGAAMPPVVVAERPDGELYWLDGSNRMTAMHHAGYHFSPAYVRLNPDAF